MTRTTTRVLVADDHVVLRQGLKLILDSQPDLKVVADVSDGAEAVERVGAGDVDLAILDVSMPRLTGLQAAEAIASRDPRVRMLMLSMHDSEQYFFEALRVGASGYVLKSAADRDLVEACRAVMRGEPFIYPRAARAVIREYLGRAATGEALPGDPLSPRETEILKLIAEGLSTKEIAADLVLSVKTVDTHRSNILEKLGMRNRVELTRYAIRRGLTQP